jgi:5-bromo-4-chloroindolyl phosphate hydrolysis protein
MWDMIERMANDRLWIYTAIAGSVFGAIFVAYISTTRIGLWFYSKVDLMLDYLIKRWGWTWLQQPEDAWRKKYPYVTKKIDELEQRLHRLEKK